MSNIEKFMNKPKEVMINGGKIMIYPLTVKELPLAVKLDSKNEEVKAKAMYDLMMSSLKKSFPEASEEDIEKLDVGFLKEYGKHMEEVNKLK